MNCHKNIGWFDEILLNCHKKYRFDANLKCSPDSPSDLFHTANLVERDAQYSTVVVSRDIPSRYSTVVFSSCVPRYFVVFRIIPRCSREEFSSTPISRFHATDLKFIHISDFDIPELVSPNQTYAI